MKSSNDIEDIKDIFASIPDGLELDAPPTADIDAETFAQILTSVGKLMKEEQSSKTRVKMSMAVERLITMIKESQPHINDREKRERSNELIHVLESLKASIRNAKSGKTTKDLP